MASVWEKVDAVVKARHIPVNIIFELTRRCNLRCLHCYNIKDQADLSFPQIEAAFRQLREAGCLFLTLTGGEVFLRKDIRDVLSLARRMGFDLKIITNGTLISPDIIPTLKKAAPSEIGVSLHGATPEIHDRITGVPGSFARVVQAVQSLKAHNLPVHIKCTLMKENLHQHDAVVSLAKEWGVVYIMDPIISPRDDGDKGVLAHRLDEDQLKEFYCGQLASLDKKMTLQNGFPCDAGQTFGAVSATGEVYPCIQLPLSCGNIFHSPFQEVWETSPALKRIREAQADDFKACRGCEYERVCTRCPGLAYLEDGDHFGPSRVGCLMARICQEADRPIQQLA